MLPPQPELSSIFPFRNLRKPFRETPLRRCRPPRVSGTGALFRCRLFPEPGPFRGGACRGAAPRRRGRGRVVGGSDADRSRARAWGGSDADGAAGASRAPSRTEEAEAREKGARTGHAVSFRTMPHRSVPERHGNQRGMPGLFLRFRGGRRQRPVEPNPPAPRWVSESSSTCSQATCRYSATTIWAMRSPGSTVKGSPLRLARMTFTSPR